MHYLTVRSDLIFLHCAHTPHCRATVSKRFDYTTIQFMERGEVELVYGDDRIVMRGPYLWPCMPGPYIRFHRASGCDAWEHRYAAFTGPGVRSLTDPGRLLCEPLAVPQRRVERIRQAFDELIGYASAKDDAGRRRATNLLEWLLLEGAEIRGSTPDDATPWLDPILAALNRPGAPAPDYEKLARDAGVSLSSLRRRFRTATGIPLHEYHLRARIAAARTLLADGRLPIKRIASQLGYRDVFFFTRQFTARTGVSPAAYRASALRG